MCKDKDMDDLIFDLSEILEGLDIIQLASNETGYRWSGINKTKTKDVVLGILNGKNKLDNSTSWKGFCKIVPMVVQGRKGGRVYINQTENKHQDRPLKLSLAVLKILEMVELPGSSIYSGIIWTGESDIFEVWDRSQVKAYSTSSLQLMQAKIDIKKTEVNEDLLKLALARAEENPVFLPLPRKNVMDYNQAYQACKCGFKKMKKLKNRGPTTTFNRKIVLSGHKKRTRCKACKGCLAESCNKCKFCIHPKWKKPCIKRVCSTPIAPRCPCFT